MRFLKDKIKTSSLGVINFARLVFAALIFFELLNYLKILQLNTQFTWLGLLITSIVSLILLEVTAYKYKRKKGHYLHWSIWLIVAGGLSLDAFGDFFHFYGKFEWWDRTTHFFISAVVCFTLFIVINAFWIDKFKFSLILKTGRLKLSLFLAATSSITLGVFYEMEEYFEDVFFHTNRLGPGTDTVNDLVFNSLGVLTVVVFILIYYFITHKRKIFD